MDAGDDSSPLHIVVFPWLAFGHIFPCLELAERLASRGHRVSFVSTLRNLSRLRPVAPALASLIDVVALPFPHVDGLPDGAEATCDVPAGQLELLMEASDGLAPPFSAFLDSAHGSGNKVDWLVIDSFHCSIADVARVHKVPCALSMPYSAASSVLFGVPDPKNMKNNRMPVSVAQRFVHTLDKCQIIAYRSCCEFEPESMPLMPNIFGKPVVPLGLLPPPTGGLVRDPGNAAVSWLDAQPPKSVVFVAFGSEYPMTVKQLHEMALGLELAGTRFLWALRKPNGVVVSGDDDVLPPGFEERTRGRGMVATGWVPQTSILAHGATGSYMTHCGWGSTIEGLQCGLPMVMLPALVDHLAASRLMADRKVGVSVQKGEKDEAFQRGSIERAIRAVMCDDEGSRVFAANAKKMQEIVADKCHERHIDEFVQYLRSYKD